MRNTNDGAVARPTMSGRDRTWAGALTVGTALVAGAAALGECGWKAASCMLGGIGLIALAFVLRSKRARHEATAALSAAIFDLDLRAASVEGEVERNQERLERVLALLEQSATA